MASSSSSQTILITGSSGHAGAHILVAFLNRGYNVRAAMRSQSSADKVSRMLDKIYPNYPSQLSFVIVPDFIVPGAFDQVVKDVHGIIHVASPLRMDTTEVVRDILDPAIKGTTSILASAHHHGSKVRRVIITGSMVSVFPFRRQVPADQIFTEDDWMDMDYDTAASSGHAGIAYAASKILAERASVEYVATHVPHFTVMNLIPPSIFGPQISPLASIRDLNLSPAVVYRLVSGVETDVPRLLPPTYVDVRDLAEAHLKAFEAENATGQRYLICGDEPATGQKIVDIIREKFPELQEKVPLGEPGKEEVVWRFSNSKAKRELGIRFRTLEETMLDTVQCVLKLEEELKNLG